MKVIPRTSWFADAEAPGLGPGVDWQSLATGNPGIPGTGRSHSH